MVPMCCAEMICHTHGPNVRHGEDLLHTVRMCLTHCSGVLNIVTMYCTVDMCCTYMAPMSSTWSGCDAHSPDVPNSPHCCTYSPDVLLTVTVLHSPNVLHMQSRCAVRTVPMCRATFHLAACLHDTVAEHTQCKHVRAHTT